MTATATAPSATTVQQYQYDHEDRLTRITMTGGPVAFYYDQDGGQRARVVKDGIVGQERITRYFSDLVHTTHDGKTVRRYFLGSRLIASREIASTSWQLAGGPAFGEPGSGVEFAAAGPAGNQILIVALGREHRRRPPPQPVPRPCSCSCRSCCCRKQRVESLACGCATGRWSWWWCCSSAAHTVAAAAAPGVGAAARRDRS